MSLSGHDPRAVPLLSTHQDSRPVVEKVPQRKTPHSAKDAYNERDREASRRIHTQRPNLIRSIAEERHGQTSTDYLKCLVFGGLDGIVTIFAIVAGCVGAHLSPLQIVIVGFGNLLADAVSMGFGEYVGAKTEQDYISTEKAREVWEVENFPEGEKQEMMEIYEEKYGFTPEDAKTMVDITFKYKDFCISHMMAEELGLLVVDDNTCSPISRGAVMFGSFCLFGLVPLVGFGVSSWVMLDGLGINPHTRDGEIYAFCSASTASLVTLYILGALKATFVNQSSIKSGVQMVANGCFAGLVAFGVGGLLQGMTTGTPM